MRDKFLDKAVIMNLPIQEIETTCGNKCYLVEVAEDNHVLYIPDNVTKPSSAFNDQYNDTLNKLRGCLKVRGGHNIRSTDSMFSNCNLELLDLNKLESQNIKVAYDMFLDSKIKKLKIDRFNTSTIDLMTSMFEGFETEELDLSNFDTTNVISMSRMFYRSKIKKLNIHNFSENRLISVNEMFKQSETQTIDLSWVTMSKLREYKDVLYWAKVKEVNITKEDWINNSIFYQIDCEAKLTVVNT